jgi:quercetin dioxygenase-like cupin family protein
MSEFTRRNVLGAATGSMIATTASMQASADGQPPFGPTPAPLAGATLPSFRFALGAVTPKSWDGGWAKEATVAEFPVSEKLAGVLMSLAPGALRELHWHANAAEWAYVIRGHCRVTTINPQSRSQIADFGPGDVWYFPRGFGHSIQGIGAQDCLFSCLYSTTAISPSSARSASATGSDTHRPRYWRRISGCRRKPSRIFRKAKSTSPRDRCRRRSRPILRREASTAARSPIAIGCRQSAPKIIPAGRFVSSRNASSRFQRP